MSDIKTFAVVLKESKEAKPQGYFIKDTLENLKQRLEKWKQPLPNATFSYQGISSEKEMENKKQSWMNNKSMVYNNK